MTNTIFVDLIKTPTIKRLLGRPQRYRWRAVNAGNFRVQAVSGEFYTNENDCVAAIQQLFGASSEVYLRRPEFGDQVLRLAQDPA